MNSTVRPTLPTLSEVSDDYTVPLEPYQEAVPLSAHSIRYSGPPSARGIHDYIISPSPITPPPQPRRATISRRATPAGSHNVVRGSQGANRQQSYRTPYSASSTPRRNTEHADYNTLLWTYQDTCAENDVLRAKIKYLQRRLDTTAAMMADFYERADAEAHEYEEGAQYFREQQREIKHRNAELQERENHFQQERLAFESQRRAFDAEHMEFQTAQQEFEMKWLEFEAKRRTFEAEFQHYEAHYQQFEAWKRKWGPAVLDHGLISDMKKEIQSEIIAEHKKDRRMRSMAGPAEMEENPIQSQAVEKCKARDELARERQTREFLEDFVYQDEIQEQFEKWVKAKDTSSSSVSPEVEDDVHVGSQTAKTAKPAIEPIILEPVTFRKRSITAGRSRNGSIASIANYRRSSIASASNSKLTSIGSKEAKPELMRSSSETKIIEEALNSAIIIDPKQSELPSLSGQGSNAKRLGQIKTLFGAARSKMQKPAGRKQAGEDEDENLE